MGMVVVGGRGIVAEPEACAGEERRMGVAFCLSMVRLWYRTISDRDRATLINVARWRGAEKRGERDKQKRNDENRKDGAHSSRLSDCL